jgi:hypothetical protein
MSAAPPTIPLDVPRDDTLTVVAISLLAAMLASMLHEGVGHALPALLMGAQSGVLSTVAWSSTFESKWVDAGGALVNIAAAGMLWLGLRLFKNASARTRYFLLIACAFNLFDGTGYFFFSGVTDFGDWAQVIAGAHPHWLWRTILIVVGVAAYYGAVLVLGLGFVRYFGIALNNSRLRKLTIVPYVSAIALVAVSALFNPIGIQLVWQSAIPATAGAHSGLLWFRYYIRKGIAPTRSAGGIERSYLWISTAAVLSLIFIVVLGRGITLGQ